MNHIEHVIYRLRNAQVLRYPFPHFYVEGVFPWDFYEKLLAEVNSQQNYEPMPYKHRAACAADIPLVAGMDTPHFAAQVLTLFEKEFFGRYPNTGRPRFRHDLRFIRDEEGYAIGPHTDAPFKVVSLLFYLPEDSANPDCGTSIFVPDDGEKTCSGGPHYPFSGFQEVWRAPFVPNSVFGFWKTNNSWHGVHPIQRKIRRDALLFNIYDDSGQKS